MRSPFRLDSRSRTRADSLKYSVDWTIHQMVLQSCSNNTTHITTTQEDSTFETTPLVRYIPHITSNCRQLRSMGDCGDYSAMSSVSYIFGRVNYSTLVGPVTLAYTFGLRHALDADHIAAIDNVFHPRS